MKTQEKRPEIFEWLEKARVAVEKNSAAKWPDCSINWRTLSYSEGPKYIKVWERPIDRRPMSGSIYCFIDAQGNIYKPAGTNAPAKGIRGTIDTVNPDLLDGSGGWLYRG